MKILLFGEYSGLFNSLKDGFIALGNEVFMASNGDGFRNYPSDYRFDMHVKGKLGNVVSLFNVCTNLKRFTGYDVVLMISPNPLFKVTISYAFLNFLIKNNKKVFISGAGLCTNSFNYWYNKVDSKYFYYTHADVEGAPNKFAFPFYGTPKRLELEINMLRKSNGIIPILYEYSEPFREFTNLAKTIPIPINLSKFEYKPNWVRNKIVFFHGLTRPCKGGEYILKAFEIVSKKYPNDAEFIAKGGLPFVEYMQLIARTNVVLDDVNAYSLGMNGLFSMAKGKIVMGGAEEIAARELGYSFCPAINLVRNVDQIVSAIENILENKKQIEEIGFESRRFVETYHDHIKIARKYIEVFEKY